MKKFLGIIKKVFKNFSFTPLVLIGIVSFIIVGMVLTGGIIAFKNLITDINRAVEGEPLSDVPPETIMVDFNAIDNIALKLDIEIPAHDIPTDKYRFTNSPPLIFNFSTTRKQVSPQDNTPVYLNVFDPDRDELEAEWTTTGGKISLLTPLGPARWTAPKTPGDYTIQVKVSDNKRGSNPVSASLTIRVLPGIPKVIPEDDHTIYTRLVGLVKEEGSEDIYLVKEEGETYYKRIVVSTDVISFYPDLDINLIQSVPRGVLNDYITTDWIRGKERFKVYKVNPDKSKQWLNMEWETFLSLGGLEEAVFRVSEEEIIFYPSGPDILTPQEGIEHIRDSKRKNDLQEIALLLSEFTDDVGLSQGYPKTEGVIFFNKNSPGILKEILVPDYTEVLPTDPLENSFYGYTSDGITFLLSAVLENSEDTECSLEEGLCIYRINEKNK